MDPDRLGERRSLFIDTADSSYAPVFHVRAMETGTTGAGPELGCGTNELTVDLEPGDYPLIVDADDPTSGPAPDDLTVMLAEP